MITYRLLLVITAACSALITALIINPANSDRLTNPIHNLASPIWMHKDNSIVTESQNAAEPLTMAIRICTSNSCEFITLSAAEAKNLLSTENESTSQSDEYQITVPLQLPQRRQPVIEM